MKKLFILFVLLCSVAVSNAQEKETEKPQSKAALFENSIGSLIRKESYVLPRVGGAEMDVVILTDIITGTKIGCLRMKTKYHRPYTEPDIFETYAGYIDFEELDAAIKSLSYIKETILPTTPDVDTRFTFNFKDGGELRIDFNEKTKKWVFSIYTTIKLYSETKCDVTQLSEMIEIMKTAKSKIQELTK